MNERGIHFVSFLPSFLLPSFLPSFLLLPSFLPSFLPFIVFFFFSLSFCLQSTDLDVAKERARTAEARAQALATTAKEATM